MRIGGGDAALREMEGLKEMNTKLREALDTKGTEAMQAEKRLREMTFELKSVRAIAAEENGRHAIALSEALMAKKQLAEQVEALKASGTSLLEMESEETGVITRLDAQVASLGQQLLRKESVVLELQAERAALKSKLQDLTQRVALAERRLLEYKDIEGDEDEEDGGDASMATVYAPQSQLVNRRGRQGFGEEPETVLGEGSASGASAKKKRGIVDDLYAKTGVRANPAVAGAMNALDGWMLVTGRFLKNYPILRLAFLLYLLMLHLWALVILAIHLHSIEIDESMGSARIAGGHGR